MGVDPSAAGPAHSCRGIWRSFKPWPLAGTGWERWNVVTADRLRHLHTMEAEGRTAPARAGAELAARSISGRSTRVLQCSRTSREQARPALRGGGRPASGRSRERSPGSATGRAATRSPGTAASSRAHSAQHGDMGAPSSFVHRAQRDRRQILESGLADFCSSSSCSARQITSTFT